MEEIKNLKEILPNNAKVEYIEKDKRIYISVEPFDEKDYSEFQQKLFGIIPEKEIKEIYITEFYRQFSIFLYNYL
jgi:hypothetical protein